MKKLIFVFCLLLPLPVSGQGWLFQRSTTAYKTFSAGGAHPTVSHMSEVGVDHPRVAGRGGGLLVEGQTTQLQGETEAFQNWTQSGVCAVTVDNYVAPNGTLTADLLDNTGGANTDFRVIATANLGALAGRTFTGSVWVRAATPHTITLRMYENPAIGDVVIQSFYATAEWQRFSIAGTSVGGGSGTLGFLVYPGERLVATGAAHFWGANLTETTFPTSYIPNAGVATSQVTRTADSISMDVLEAGTNNRVLADVYAPNTNADKLTIYGEWKAEWSSATDIGVISRQLMSMGRVADADNNIQLYVSTLGRVFAWFQDDAGVLHTINSAVNPVVFSEWFSVRVVWDFTDLSRSELYINEAVDHAADANLTGGATYDTTNVKIRIGATNGGVVAGFHHTRNLRINNAYIPAP